MRRLRGGVGERWPVANVAPAAIGTSRHAWVGGASLTGGRRVGTPVDKVASVSDEPSNTASEFMRGTYAVLNDFESPPHEMIRSSFTDDFVYEDRRLGAIFR